MSLRLLRLRLLSALYEMPLELVLVDLLRMVPAELVVALAGFEACDSR